MEDASTWPLGQVLPLKRETNDLFPELGLLVAGVGPCVHHLTLAEATPRNLRLCRTERFTSFDMLRAAGWRID